MENMLCYTAIILMIIMFAVWVVFIIAVVYPDIREQMYMNRHNRNIEKSRKK